MSYLARLFVLIACVTAASSHAESIGVLGDSLSVGTFAHPSAAWDVHRLENLTRHPPRVELSAYDTDFQKLIPQPDGQILPATRLWALKQEHADKNPLKALANEALTHGYKEGMERVDINEYAWPYLLGRAEGAAGNKVFIAAQAGQRSNDAYRQARRLIIGRHHELPEQVFIFLGHNDICSLHLGQDNSAWNSAWTHEMRRGVLELIKNGKPAEAGTTIYIVPPIDPTFLIESDVVLNKKTFAYGEERTCRDFRNLDPGTVKFDKKKAPIMALLIEIFGDGSGNIPSPKSSCKAIFKVQKGEPGFEDHVATVKPYVAALYRASNDVYYTAVAGIKEAGKQDKLQVKVLKSTTTFRVERPEEMANDCFHLSLTGQEHLAREILKEIRE